MLFHIVMLTSPAVDPRLRQKHGGPLDVKCRKIVDRPKKRPNSVTIVMDAHVCQPLTRCISEND